MSQTLSVVAAPTADLSGSTSGLARLIMPSAAAIERARSRLHAKAIVIGALGLLSYLGLVVAPVGTLVRIGLAAVLIVAVVATAASVMHDANHAAFARSSRANQVLGWSGDLLGLSSWLWKFKHNSLHHGNTNVVGIDSDIDQAPFARLAPEQPWKPYHRHQHVYLWFLYGFMPLKSLLLADANNLIRNRIGDQPLARRPTRRVVVGLVAGKVAHLGWALAIPLAFHPWWGVLAFYLVCSWVVGFLLAVVFQLAHCVDAAEIVGNDAPRRGEDFIAHQLRTTVNIRCRVPGVRTLVHFVVGGLDHQIEHHIAPRLPHTAYPLVAASLEAECRRRGLPYRVHGSIASALRSHTRHLRAMGRQPAPA